MNKVTSSTLGGFSFDPFGVGKFWQDTATRTKVELWLDRDVREHKVDDGTTACGRYYQHLKRETQQVMDGIVWPVRTMVTDTLMHNASLQDMMRSPAMAEQFRFIDRIIRERYPNEHGALYRPEYNHQFLTEDSADKIVTMDDADVVKLFAPENKAKTGELFPHILITSSHAQGETLNDVTAITHGIAALARDSEGQPLPLAYVDTGITPGKTLMLFACDVEKSPLLNGAKLLDRMNELKRIAKTGEVETAYNDISPGAKRIAKLMLKCMVEEPALVDTKESRDMREIGAQNDQPVRLRADAVDIAHHFQLIGYSKGGNVVRDAMRYLVGELTAKNAHGQDVFAINPQSPQINGDGTGMTPRNISKLVRNIAVMALASVEVGMSEHYKQHGVRGVAINSDKDLISAHSNYPGSPYDERWMIQGVERDVGHAPRDMMGTRTSRGFMLDDPRVERRTKEFYAANYGKAAIGHVKFNGQAAQGEVTIEAATGTMDTQIEAFKPIIEGAVAKAMKLRPSNVTLTLDQTLPGTFALKCNGVDFTRSSDALRALHAAFTELRTEIKGLLITQSILDPKGDIDQQISRVGARGRG